jgi:hypothetical protein
MIMVREVKIWRVMVSALLFMLVAQAVHTLEAMLTMGYYTDERYAAVWSRIMMPEPGPPPASFYIYSLVFNFIAGLMFAFVYAVVGPSIPGGKTAAKGLMYGLLIFLVAGVPGYLSLFLLINLPVGLIRAWTASGLVVYLIAGMVTASIQR